MLPCSRRCASWGLPVESHWRRCDGIEAVASFCQEWADGRQSLEFDTDGVVVKVDDLALRERLGATAKFPRWATAFKFPAQQAHTTILHIKVNVGRTGAVTPYAELEPVLLAGTTISMATLHNAEDVARKDLREGDTVVLEKGGDVIPKIVAPILSLRPPGSDTVADAGDLPGLRQRVAARRGGGRLAVREHVVPGAAAAGPRALRVALGDEHRRARRVARRSAHHTGTGSRFRGPLSSPGGAAREPCRHAAGAAFRTLPRRASSARSGATSSSKSNAARRNDLSRLIYALGIRHVGEKAAATLARHFRTMDRIIEAPAEALQSVSEIGPVVAASVRMFADEPSNQALVARLKDAGVNMESQAPDVDVRARPAGRTGLRVDGDAVDDDARAGSRGAGTARRTRLRVGEQEDAVPGRRRRGGEQARQSAPAWRRNAG